MSQVNQKFKDIFTSEKNTKYMIDYVYLKLSKIYPIETINKNNIKYKKCFIDIQIYVFNSFFTQICNDLQAQNRMNLENVLILLNKITMEQFEYLINQDMQQKMYFTQNERVRERHGERPRESEISRPRESELQEREISRTREIELQQRELQQREISRSREIELQQRELQEREIELKQHQGQEVQERENSRSREIELQQYEYKEQKKRSLDKKLDKIKNDKQVQTEAEKLRTTEHTTKLEQITKTMTSYHLVSADASINDGLYSFNVDCKKIQSLHLVRFWMECNLYNVNEYNNRFHVMEADMRISISIPIGYYKISELVNAIELLLNKRSLNKYKYQVYHDNFKNKVFFICTTRDDVPVNFIIAFENQEKHTSLHKMLGFNYTEYSGNNIYVSENFTKENIFDNIYLRLYLDNMEVCKYLTSNGSSYFECFSLNYGEYFGKGYESKRDDLDIFDMFENVDCSKISLELVDYGGNIITKHVDFHIVLGIECIE